MWLLPLLIAGAVAMAAATRSRSARTPLPPSRQLPAGPPAVSGVARLPARRVRHPGAPGPIAVLGEILRVGQVPPPPVILCAIAEAQAIGRSDLVSDIVQAFVAPVVRRHARLRARAQAEEDQAPQSPQAAPPPEGAYQAASDGTNAPQTTVPSSPRAEAPTPPPIVDDLTALLDTDPVRFMDLASRPRSAHATVPAQASSAPDSANADLREPAAHVQVAPSPTPTAQPAPAPPTSPLAEVPDPAWQAFVARLERESPDFASSRHVGQFRQRRERLADLGIDPKAIHGSPGAQRAALDADLADAHQHAAAGGLLAHLGRPIVVPGRDDAESLTLSGLLGVIQCAGLDGAVGWLERSSDRRKFPHTTQTFLSTNGVF